MKSIVLIVVALIKLSIGVEFPSKVPLPLIRLGLKLFDSNETMLLDIINNMEEPQEVRIEGQMLSLVQYKGDTSIGKLKGEFTNNDNYGLVRLDNVVNGTFIDIGANLGAISIFVAKKYFAKNLTVICFEPIPVTYFLLRYNMYLNHIYHHQNHTDHISTRTGPSIYAFNNAFGSEFTIKNFVASKTLSQFSAASDKSVDELSKENGLEWVSVKIVVVPLSFIESNFHINVIDFLKLDCEGCEFDLIVSLENFFKDKERLKYLGAEIHLSLMWPNEETIARKPNSTVAQSALNILRERGCGKINWQINC
jgi:FkbM family methyltransferase